MDLGCTTPRTYKAFAAGAMFACGTVFAQPSVALTVDDIVARVVESDRAQEKNLHEFQVIRRYELRKADGSKSVEATARVGYDLGGEKKIEILDERGSEGLFRRAIRKVIEGEAHASDEQGRKEMRISPENYGFRLAGMENQHGRRCYVLQLLPKRKSKYLIDGKAWIDAQEFAIVRVEGRPSASVSFWVGKPYITQTFQKVGDVWFLSRNNSRAEVKLVGAIDFIIEAREIQGPGINLAKRKVLKPLTD